MTSLPVNLRPLLGDSPESLADQPLLLCDAALDRPAEYLFEANGWREVLGAGRQLLAIRDQWAKGLPAGSVLLRAEPDRAVALVPAQYGTDWPTVWRDSIAAVSGGTMALNVGTVLLSGSQVLKGLYRAPTRVIGIPGMTDHQSRINQYYGVDNPSTLPSPERISARRHFSEALNLALANRQRSADDRLLFAFYECLPLCVRCTVCAARPAEPGVTIAPAPAMCAICSAKCQLAQNEPLAAPSYALIRSVAPGAERLLLGQPTPAAYQRTVTRLDECWRRAIGEAQKAGSVIVLWQTSTMAWLIAPSAVSLNATARLCSAFESASGPLALGKPIIGAAVVFADIRLQGGQNIANLAQVVLNSIISSVQRDSDLSPGAIGLAATESAGSDFAPAVDRLRYTPETLGRLDSAAQKFAVSGFPFGVLSPLTLQGATQAASLAFEQVRSHLTAPQRQQLDEVAREFERLWGVGTARFFQALHDVQLVQDRLRLDNHSTGTNAP